MTAIFAVIVISGLKPFVVIRIASIAVNALTNPINTMWMKPVWIK